MIEFSEFEFKFAALPWSVVVPLVTTEPAESKTFVITEPADKKFESLHCL